MSYTTDMKNVNIGISSFSSLIEDGLVYVDKSMYGYNLLKTESARFFFIARPRRFGKSLFVSMLESALMGKREMFEGLYLGSSDYDFHPYPVIHLDLSSISSEGSSADNFSRQLNRIIADTVRPYGVDVDLGDEPGNNLYNAIQGIYRKAGERVAVLIDEYDNPLTSSLNNPEGSLIRAKTRDMYGQLKPCADKIRFLFITGITRFSNQSHNWHNTLLQPVHIQQAQQSCRSYLQQGIRGCIRLHAERDGIIFRRRP